MSISIARRRVLFVGRCSPCARAPAPFAAALASRLAAAGEWDARLLAIGTDDLPPAVEQLIVGRLDASTPLGLAEAGESCYDLGADVVCLNHDWSAFSGQSGVDVLHFVWSLDVPLVTVLQDVARGATLLQRRVLAELARRSASLVVTSERRAQVLSQLCPGAEPAVIGVPVPARQKVEVPAGWCSGPTVAAVALGDAGGVQHLVRAMARVVGAEPGVSCLVLCRGSERSELEPAARLGEELGVSTRVSFHGGDDMPPGRAAGLLAGALAFVLPAEAGCEGVGAALRVAAAAGLPLISTPHPCSVEMFGPGRCLLVPWADPDAMASAILRVVRSDKLRGLLAGRTAEVAAGLGWPAVCRAYGRVLASACPRGTCLAGLAAVREITSVEVG